MKYFFVEFASVCCPEIQVGVYPLAIFSGVFDYAGACKYLSDTYGHQVVITNWREIDEQTAYSMGKWSQHVHEVLGIKHAGATVSEMKKPEPKREEPATVKDNVIYPERWKKKNETDPVKPGPNGTS